MRASCQQDLGKGSYNHVSSSDQFALCTHNRVAKDRYPVYRVHRPSCHCGTGAQLRGSGATPGPRRVTQWNGAPRGHFLAFFKNLPGRVPNTWSEASGRTPCAETPHSESDFRFRTLRRRPRACVVGECNALCSISEQMIQSSSQQDHARSGKLGPCHAHLLERVPLQ